MAQQAGENGRVFAIEPAPANAARLRANLAANRFEQRVEVIEAACGAEPGETTFHIHRHNDMWSRVDLPQRGEPDRILGGPKAWDQITVPVDTLHGLVGPSADRVTVIKLDIEGAEEQVCATIPDHFTHPDLCVAVEARAPHIQATLQPFEDAGFHPYDLKNDYRWMFGDNVKAASKTTFADLYGRRFVVDVLLSRRPIPVAALQRP